MKKQFTLYYLSVSIFFLLVSLYRGWFDPMYLAFWVGGAIGAILPDLDHLIYVYFLRPHELSSQRAMRMMSRGEVVSTFSFLANTRNERTRLIFHTAMFQLVFLAFAFFVATSSSSLLGKGLVLAFSVHLLVDQVLDFRQTGSIVHWFRNINVELNREKTAFYWVGNAVVLIILGFFL